MQHLALRLKPKAARAKKVAPVQSGGISSLSSTAVGGWRIITNSASKDHDITEPNAETMKGMFPNEI
jgi:hypothetical protein